jgi:uncharacterized protein (TIGR02117 family)
LLLKSIRVISLTISVIVALAMAGIILPKPFWPASAGGPASHRILILSNPIHTDIAIPVDDALRARFGFVGDSGLDLRLDGVRYLIFGWGGRAFYTQTPTWADLKTIPVLKSLTLDRSVMHVELAGSIPDDSPYAMAVNLDLDGYERLIGAIRQSFAGGGAPIAVTGYAYGPYDAFFEANGYFNVVAGCNTWTAAMLRQSGLATGWWTPLPWMLRTTLRLHNTADVVAR